MKVTENLFSTSNIGLFVYLYTFGHKIIKIEKDAFNPKNSILFFQKTDELAKHVQEFDDPQNMFRQYFQNIRNIKSRIEDER